MPFTRFAQTRGWLARPDDGGGTGGAPAPAEPPVTPEPQATSAESPPSSEAAPSAPEPAGETDGASRRINQLTAEKWSERRAREQAEARAKLAEDTLAELQRLAQASPQSEAPDPALTQPRPGPRTYTEEEVNRLAEERAAIQAQNLSFQQNVAKIVTDGRAAMPDFDQSVMNLQNITGPMLPRPFIEAVMVTAAPAEVLYQLGKNVQEADRILSLPPIQQAVELARLGDKIAADKAASRSVAPKKISDAPAPISAQVGVSGTGNEDLSNPNLSIAEWMAIRNKQASPQRRRA